MQPWTPTTRFGLHHPTEQVNANALDSQSGSKVRQKTISLLQSCNILVHPTLMLKNSSRGLGIEHTLKEYVPHGFLEHRSHNPACGPRIWAFNSDIQRQLDAYLLHMRPGRCYVSAGRRKRASVPGSQNCLRTDSFRSLSHCFLLQSQKPGTLAEPDEIRRRRERHRRRSRWGDNSRSKTSTQDGTAIHCCCCCCNFFQMNTEHCDLTAAQMSTHLDLYASCTIEQIPDSLNSHRGQRNAMMSESGT